jgi:DNA polymerase-3 subunit gamma/tau
VIFVFATTEPQKIQQAAPPILSRCQRFDFHRIGTTDLVRRMREVLRGEGVAAGDDVLLPIAQKADGGMRDALSLLDQVLSFTDGEPTAADVHRVLGLVGDELYLELMDVIAERRHAEVFSFVQRLLSDGFDLAEFYRGLADFLRALLMIRLGGTGAEVREDLRDRYTAAAERFAPGDLLRMLSQVAELDADGRFRKSGQQQILIELLLLRFSFLDSTVALEDVLRALGGPSAEPEGRASTGNPRPGPAAVREAPAPAAERAAPAPRPAPPTPPEPRPDPAAGPLDLRQLRHAWRAVLEEGEGVPGGMGLVLRAAQVAVQGEDTVRVDVAPGSALLERMESPAASRPLEQALSHRLGRAVRVVFAAVSGGAAEPGANRITAETARRDRLDRLTREEPLLAAAVQEWDLELID